ncbi:T9SS type B sorting domain-containing protein [Labilibaculum sp. A4]|uniref:gliding motility-associated C-terminal domain-containing protein n=1 Tax=Labilibaculum euxinus TaxID=2686357 RepID=UPI000F61C67C|nr:gliding motility-associated C-terminal domain-containing protein [Labilibaculum euxinus]MDQ1771651.1 gliding motility-associated C-terminal domain-containing protein [Labilibaculum euxinus]MWN77360.1 T9SS type B sorting domain-containing protein [Labilibaculum euxinus]
MSQIYKQLRYILLIIYLLSTSFAKEGYSLHHSKINLLTSIPDNSLSITIDKEIICEGELTQIHITQSEIGVNYQLKSEDTNIGSPQAGNGSTIHFTITPNYSTAYHITAINAITLESIDLSQTVSIEVINKPDDNIAVSISEDQICIGEKTIISLNSSQLGVSYQLYDGTYMQQSPIQGNNSSISFPEFSPFRSVIYHIVATNNTCASTSTLQQTAKVLVGLPPEDHLHPTIDKHTICKDEEVIISLTPTDPAVSYQLFAGDTPIGSPLAGNSEDINFEPTIPSSSTTYRIEALGNKCINPINIRYTVDVDVHNPPQIDRELIASREKICVGEEVVLSIENSEEGIYYQIHDGSNFLEANIIGNGNTITFPSLKPLKPTKYQVYAYESVCTDKKILSSSKQIDLFDITPLSLESFVTPSEICLGELVDVELPTSIDGIEYILHDGNEEIGSITGSGEAVVFEEILPKEQSSYKITIGNCADEFIGSKPEIVVHKNPKLQILSRDVQFENDGQLTISTTDGTPPYQFIIDPGDTYSIEENVLELDNLAIGTYQILVVDANYCRSSDAGQLTEIHLEDGKKVVVGNALTPNGDGKNDEWLIQYESDLNAPEVSIFNIYGQEIYHAKSYQNNWKGSYNGSILPNGAYYYLIDFNSEKINPIRGTISILGKN